VENIISELSSEFQNAKICLLFFAEAAAVTQQQLSCLVNNLLQISRLTFSAAHDHERDAVAELGGAARVALSHSLGEFDVRLRHMKSN